MSLIESETPPREPRKRPRWNGKVDRRSASRSYVVRRPDREQGTALEVLGHAVEYLIDSRMAQIETPYTRSDEEALQLLMGCSRSVFESCAEVISLRNRAAGWLRESFLGRALSEHTPS